MPWSSFYPMEKLVMSKYNKKHVDVNQPKKSSNCFDHPVKHFSRGVALDGIPQNPIFQHRPRLFRGPPKPFPIKRHQGFVEAIASPGQRSDFQHFPADCSGIIVWVRWFPVICRFVSAVLRWHTLCCQPNLYFCFFFLSYCRWPV